MLSKDLLQGRLFRSESAQRRRELFTGKHKGEKERSEISRTNLLGNWQEGD